MLDPWTIIGLGVALLFVAVPGLTLLCAAWLFPSSGSGGERPQPSCNAVPERRIPGGERKEPTQN